MDKVIMFNDSYAYKLWYEFESEEHYQQVLENLREHIYELRAIPIDDDFNSQFDIMDHEDRVVLKCIGNKLKYAESDYEELDV